MGMSQFPLKNDFLLTLCGLTRFYFKSEEEMVSTPTFLQECSIRGVKVNSHEHFSVTTSFQLLWLQSFHCVDIISPIV